VLSGRGLCVKLISRPEESYRMRWAWVWSLSLDNGRLWLTRGRWGKKMSLWSADKFCQNAKYKASGSRRPQFK
jgi:hypothetical protein